MILTEAFKRWLYTGTALVLWLACITLAVADSLDGTPGMEISIAVLVGIAAGTMTVTAWLQWHLPMLTEAFTAGISAGKASATTRSVSIVRQREE